MYGKTMLQHLRTDLGVTVPAVRSERAQDLLLQAVRMAKFNFDRVFLITEPEAATIYTLRGLIDNTDESSVQTGDVVTLVDCGDRAVESSRITSRRLARF